MADMTKFERRRSTRVGVRGRAELLHGGEIVGRYRVSDLSLGGLLVEDGPPCQIGQVYGAVLEVGDEPLREPVWVMHQRVDDRGGCTAGLSFLQPSVALCERVQRLTLAQACGAATARGSLLLVMRDPRERARLRTLLQPLGYRIVEAGSVSRAVWTIERELDEFRVVVVARELGAADGRDVLRYLRAQHPGIRRVLLEPEGQPGDIAPAHADAVLRGAGDAAGFARSLRFE